MSSLTSNVVINGIDVTNSIKKYVEATKALKAAKTAEDIKKLNAIRQQSISSVASVLSSFIPSEKARMGASVALNTYYLVHETTSLASSASLGAILGVVGGIAGALFGLAGLFGAFGRKKKKTITLMWSATVSIKVEYTSNGVRLVPSVKVTSNNVDPDGSIAKSIIEICNDVNASLKDIPPEAMGFIKKYLPVPPVTNTYTIQIEVRVTDSVGDKGDVKKLVRKFNQKLSEELKRVTNIIRRIGEDIAILAFLYEIGAQDRIDAMAMAKLTDLGYNVEGMWRKELERLSIKLTRTREYDRQIDHALRAAAVQTLMDMIYYAPRWGSAVLMSKTAVINRIQSLCDSNTELRYGFDLIGRKVGTYRPKKWLKLHDKISEYFFADYRFKGPFPADFLETQASYIFRPSVSGGKVAITYVPKSVSIANRVYVRHKGWYYCTSGRDASVSGYKYSDCFDPRRCIGDESRVVYHKDTDGKPWLLPRPSTSDVDHPLIDKVLKFVNYLLSDIPSEAANYIAKNVSTVEGYMKYYRLFHDPGVFSVKYYLGGRTRFIPQWAGNPSGSKCMAYALSLLMGLDKAFIHGHDLSTYIKNVSSIYVPVIDREDITNLCRVLNALMLDIVDVYNIWLKGYAVEWKKRQMGVLFQNALPQIRGLLMPTIRAIAKTYANLPDAAIDVGVAEMDTYVASKLSELESQISDYLPVIEKNKEWIIKMFGEDEYNRLTAEANAMSKITYESLMNMFKTGNTKDLDKLLDNLMNMSSKIDKMSDDEKEALKQVLISLHDNLSKIAKSLSEKVTKYNEAINKLTQVCGR